MSLAATVRVIGTHLDHEWIFGNMCKTVYHDLIIGIFFPSCELGVQWSTCVVLCCGGVVEEASALPSQAVVSTVKLPFLSRHLLTNEHTIHVSIRLRNYFARKLQTR
jgi:hypothetical protein